MVRHLISLALLILLCSILGCASNPERPLKGPKAAPAKSQPPLRPEAEITSGMILIPAGNFYMGCDPSKKKEKCNLVELPLHKVYLDAYYIDRTEVTVGQYRACLAAGYCTEPIRTYSDSHRNYFYDARYANFPVIYVTWFQARDYCTWAGKRLPTEAEWEKAARGIDSTRIYPWGNTEPDCRTANIKVKSKQCTGDVQAAGSYKKDNSLYGVADLAGNVREWINDWYEPGYYKESPNKNPSGPATGMYVVMRGGRFDNTWPAARIAARRTIGPNDYGAGIGFRCAYSSK